MDKTKIEWADATWNPVTGCYNNCEYCYARRIATRFGGNDKHSTFRYGQKDWHRADNNKDSGMFYDEASAGRPMLFVVEKQLFLPRKLDKRKTEKYGRQIFESKKAPYPFDFNPTLHRYRLEQPKKWKEPRTIFVCSMADLFGRWVPDEWIEEVFEACEKATQHRYLFLTKNPARYEELRCKHKLPVKENFWYGSTITKPTTAFWSKNEFNTFLSIEPLLERFEERKTEDVSPYGEPRWIILGAETGNRAGKVTPEKEWVDIICAAAGLTQAAVFMKDSLLPIVGEENMRRETPWAR